MQTHNRKKLEEKRRELRKDSTPAERAMWSLLRNGNVLGRKFKRQHGIGNYIVDFYCSSEKLIIELDGAGHFTIPGMDYDNERDKYLQSLGFKILRFENSEFKQRPDAVLYRIIESFSQKTTFEMNEDNLNKVVDMIMETWSKK